MGPIYVRPSIGNVVKMPDGTDVRVLDPWSYKPDATVAGFTIAGAIESGMLFVEYPNGLRTWIAMAGRG